MIDVLREVGMIERALDSMSNIEFKEIGLSNLQFLVRPAWVLARW